MMFTFTSWINMSGSRVKIIQDTYNQFLKKGFLKIYTVRHFEDRDHLNTEKVCPLDTTRNNKHVYNSKRLNI